MSTRKVRVSATIRPDLAHALERAGPNRSAVLESILERWVEESSRDELNREIARYYRRYAAAEKREEESWIRRSSRTLVRAVDDEPDD
jgi:hypothetical protein